MAGPTTIRSDSSVFDGENLDEWALVSAVALGGEPGVVVDVGAFYGGQLRGFARSGWRVIAIEPDPAKHAKLDTLAASHPGVTVHKCAIGEAPSDDAVLFSSEESAGISSLSAFRATHTECARVPVRRLDALIDTATAQQTRVLKVDAEGHDLFVLRSWDWAAGTPDLVVAEFEDRKSVPLGYSAADLGGFLLERGLRVFRSEWAPIERYGVRHRWRRITRYTGGEDLVDDDAWGNYIGARDDATIDAVVESLGPSLA
ncbi:MAG: FkbM family methyltransferase [Planctomycetota bacterium]